MVSIKASLKLRLIAFLKHALISFVVVLCLLIFLKLVWFQGALFSLERVWNGFSILLLVDVVVGPLLTFLIYEPSKKSLKNDILIIVTLQIIALIYGIIQIHSQRPVIITYVGDRFQVILQNQNVLELLPAKTFNISDTQLPILTFSLPASTDEQKSDFLLNNTQYYLDGTRHRKIIDYIDKLKPLELVEFSIKSAETQSKLKKLQKKYHDVEFSLHPIQGSFESARVIAINNANGRILEILDIDPWSDYKF
jgi:hypothetical protein